MNHRIELITNGDFNVITGDAMDNGMNHKNWDRAEREHKDPDNYGPGSDHAMEYEEPGMEKDQDTDRSVYKTKTELYEIIETQKKVIAHQHKRIIDADNVIAAYQKSVDDGDNAHDEYKHNYIEV